MDPDDSAKQQLIFLQGDKSVLEAKNELLEIQKKRLESEKMCLLKGKALLQMKVEKLEQLLSGASTHIANAIQGINTIQLNKALNPSQVPSQVSQNLNQIQLQQARHNQNQFGSLMKDLFADKFCFSLRFIA